MSDPPDELPYGNPPTSGWSGSDTSRERAEREDADGTTHARQATTLRAAGFRGYAGITVKELRADTGWHHGQASGSLSTLHKAGKLARLSLSRERCKVYVLPSQVQGRAIEPHGQTATTTMLAEMYALLNDADQIHNAVDINDPEVGRWIGRWHQAATDVMRRYESTVGQ